jgi:hypothetical protein
MQHRKVGCKYRWFAVTFAAVLSLAIPASGSATHEGGWHFHWGYNYVGQYTNNPVESGFNYWYDQYVDKSNGNEIWTGWLTPGDPGAPCGDYMSGVSSMYHQPTRCGWGGWYLKNWLRWSYGNMSYLYIDSVVSS